MMGNHLPLIVSVSFNKHLTSVVCRMFYYRLPPGQDTLEKEIFNLNEALLVK